MNIIRQFKIGIFLIFFILPFQIFANTFYISPTGSDANNCSITSPGLTIAYASSLLLPGDTLFARGGLYTGQYSTWPGSNTNIWKSNGTLSNPVLFKNMPGETPVFDGSSYTGVAALFAFVAAQNSQNIIIDGITIQNYYQGMWISYKSLNITIQNCKIGPNKINGEHGIYISSYLPINDGPLNITLKNNNFIGRLDATSLQVGIHVNHGVTAVRNLKIYNNIFTNWNYSATLIGAGANNVEVYNNTVYHNNEGFVWGYLGNDTNGINPCVGACNVIVKNNIIANNVNNGMRHMTLIDVNDVVTNNNLWFGNRFDMWWNGTGLSLAQYKSTTTNETYGFNANPNFVNNSILDFHLQSNSPAINAGEMISSITNDYDHYYRTPPLDIGAFEYVSNPLPFNQINFNAKSTPIGNQLNWLTNYNTNLLAFEVERSTDAIHFEQIGKLFAKNEFEVNTSYAFLDNQLNKSNLSPLPSTVKLVFYRLKNISKDGKNEFSKIIPVENKLQPEIVIYPNPVSEILTIRNYNNKNLNITLLDAKGSIYYKLNNIKKSKFEMNVRSIPSGIYFLQISDGIKVHYKKFLKE
ncbi:MAG: T9SS type A sorting domain-containing protein [Ferruginibacter sp.]|nr:T9SS type A sorting domain-containing protein [Ferruginibacter sp.]